MMNGTRLSMLRASRLRSVRSSTTPFHNTHLSRKHGVQPNTFVNNYYRASTSTTTSSSSSSSSSSSITSTALRAAWRRTPSTSQQRRQQQLRQLFSSLPSPSSLLAHVPPDVLRSLSEASARISQILTPEQRKTLLGIFAGLTLSLVHSMTGSANDFYDYRFPCPRDPDDLASFFGGETFMELFCIFPVVGHVMMRLGYFDDEGNVITQGVPGTMKVSMVFSDETNQETGRTDWFNKRERFRNILWGCDCWDMVTNFGFRTLEDGSQEVYLHGEFFQGNLPVVSQLMRLIFTVHARWLAWSTEHHLNHYAFAGDDEMEEHNEEESRQNMPMFLLKHYAPTDLWATLTGSQKLEKPASFLVRRATAVMGNSNDSDEEEDDEDGDDTEEEEDQEVVELRVQKHRTLLKRRVSLDIASDRESTKLMLARHQTKEPEERQVILARAYTLQRKETQPGNASTTGNAYALAREAAKERHMVRRATLQAMKVAATPPPLPKRMTSSTAVTAAEPIVEEAESPVVVVETSVVEVTPSEGTVAAAV